MSQINFIVQDTVQNGVEYGLFLSAGGTGYGGFGVLEHCRRSYFQSESVQYPDRVLDYLGRYTHRVAISNKRLQELTEGQVIFAYKDYKNEHQPLRCHQKWDDETSTY